MKYGTDWKYISPLAGPAGTKLEATYYFYAVNKASDPAKKEAAWKFLQWLFAPEQYDKQTDVAGRPPTSLKSVEKYSKDPLWKSILDVFAAAEPPLFHVKQTEMQTKFLVEFARAADGEITIEEALNNAETKINEILASS
jgi:ABC-type glycerol-3-phosphate transport system substrate-binding protein